MIRVDTADAARTGRRDIRYAMTSPMVNRPVSRRPSPISSSATSQATIQLTE
jgi:hypothetical protein